ncbi:MAG TPA: hypothetical protein VKE51_30780 [Vicinamibacterales bacterium]|nr:hypothetical protein [Vicinamibacterales bacterium]
MEHSSHANRAIRLIFRVGVCVLVTVVTRDTLSAQYTVVGRKIEWRMTAVDGWVGGSYNQIDEIRKTTNHEPTRQLSRAMLQEAVTLDAYLVNLDVDRQHTRTLTSVSVNAAGAFTDEELIGAWPRFAELVAGEGPSGSTVRVLKVTPTKVGGRRAQECVLELSLPDGAKVYGAITIVLLSASRSHLFKLIADETKFVAAYRDYHTMLASVTYY